MGEADLLGGLGEIAQHHRVAAEISGGNGNADFHDLRSLIAKKVPAAIMIEGRVKQVSKWIEGS